jgi:hypothetical protein
MMRVYTYIILYVLCMYVCMYVCMYAYVLVCMYAIMYVRVFSCMYVCMYVCMFVCMYVPMETQGRMNEIDAHYFNVLFMLIIYIKFDFSIIYAHRSSMWESIAALERCSYE